jgi:hypothetical protein
MTPTWSSWPFVLYDGQIVPTTRLMYSQYILVRVFLADPQLPSVAIMIDPPHPRETRTASPGPPTTPSPGSGASARPSSGMTPIRVTVGDQTFTAELYDNPTARDLADQLPLTITMDDLNQLEKTGPLPQALTTDGAPAGSDPSINEIGYYAPGRNLVLYYGDVGYYNGIIRIGRFDDAIDTIADLADGVTVTVERA